METKFIIWLRDQLNTKGWSNAELARQAGLTTSNISMIISGQQNPGLNFCIKVAKALDESPEQVLRMAGLLPPLPGPDEDITLKKLYDLGKRLSPEERARLLSIAELFFREEQAKYRAEKSPPGSSAAAKSTA